MQWTDLYREHLARVSDDLGAALRASEEAGRPFDAVVLHAGTELEYHRDDQAIPFVTDPHFARVVPAAGPDHLLHFSAATGLKLVQVVPRDFWYEAPADEGHPWRELLEVVVVEDEEQAVRALDDGERRAYVGPDEDVAHRLAAEVEPEALLTRLDWARGAKTRYEVECIRRAAEVAAAGHRAVRDGAAEGMSERELHFEFLRATGSLEVELPYPTIIGWNENGAVLHYQSKEPARPRERRALLIDAGVDCWGYASDITRTWTQPDAPDGFADLVDGVNALQRRLVEAVRPDLSYVDLHLEAHREVARLLGEMGVLKVGEEEALERRLTSAFLPHGLGHHLGVQVHDVGGHLLDATGRVQEPPADHPFLRTTRRLAEGHVVTIEPGIYFIDMLLEPLRGGEHASSVDWQKVDALAPGGGVRIEDDVLVTSEGSEDLSRPFLPAQVDAA